MTGAPVAAPETGAVARGSVVNVAALTLGTALTFLLTVVVSRWLQPKGAGAFFELVAVFTILANTFELGADTGLTRWISRERATGRPWDLGRTLRVALVPVGAVGACAAAGLWLAAPLMAHVFLRGIPAGQGAAWFRLVAPFVPLGALSSCVLAAARGYGRMWPYLAVEGLGKPVSRIALVAGALATGAGVRGAIALWCLPVAVGLVAAVVILRRVVRAERSAGTAADAGRVSGGGLGAAEFWRFAAPRGVAGAFQIVVVWLNVILVGAILGTYDAGVYAAVSRLVMVGTFALEGTRLAIGPHLSSLLARREPLRAAALYQVATRWLVLASWPAYVLLALFPAVVMRIFGHHYEGGAAALALLSLAMVVNLGTGNVTVVLLMGGKSSWNLINTALALAVDVTLNVVLLPHIGVAGAAIAWGASIVVDNLLAVLEVWLVLGMSPFGAGYAAIAGAVAACFGLTGAVLRTLVGDTPLALGVACLLSLPAFALVVYRARGRMHLEALIGSLVPSRRPPAVPSGKVA